MIEQLYKTLSQQIRDRKHDFSLKSKTTDESGLFQILLDITLLESQLDTLTKLSISEETKKEKQCQEN
jgi:hypothetical protein